MTTNHPPKKSRLDALETSVHQPPSTCFQDFKLRGKQAEFLAVQQAYDMWGGEEDRRRFDRLLECSTKAYFMRNKDSGDVAVMGSKCRLRWCPICADGKKHIIVENVKPWIKEQDYPKFLTLTIKHSNKPLRKQIEELYEAFKKLRRHKYFKSKVTGGIWFFQITLSKTTGQWHPHIHCAITGLFLSKKELKQCWVKATQGSFILDIKMIKEPDKAADYIARYASKPCQLEPLYCYRRVEVIEAMHGQRIVGTWGTGRAVKLTAPKVDDFANWITVGAWSTVIGTLDEDSSARRIFRRWKTGKPLKHGIDMNHIENGWYDEFEANMRRKKARLDQMTGSLFNKDTTYK